MNQVQAASGTDRLPWLEDEPTRTTARSNRSGNRREVIAWATAAMLLVASASYWIGAHSGEQEPHMRGSVAPRSSAAPSNPQIVEPRQIQPEVVFAPAPQVNPAPMREVAIARPRPERRNAISTEPSETDVAQETAATTSEASEQTAPVQDATSATASNDRPLRAWPAWQSQGARGRIVRIGAFGSRDQAKLGWRYMVGAYPAVAHLKATVVGESNSRGRHFYRFQIGTTSQAHSEVLCQRMEKIHLSCAVVGLPWKPKGVER